LRTDCAYPCVDDKTTGRCEYLSARLPLELGITTDGQAPYVTVRESSGLQMYDATAVKAVKAAAPFPPVPPELMALMPPPAEGSPRP
jgi:TonB family protein